ncbi:MAG: ectonucleotide pyrophosphatase/phosphodiesterase [Verrucomicrobiota bacterium]
MIFRRPLLLALATLAFAALGRAADAPLILISLDGFRWDYCEKYSEASPTLRQLKREGVSTSGLIPVFPTNTFPNHYTIVTGLYPAKHGIVNNDFLDPESGLIFRYNQPAVVHDSRWWGGEPIWVTAIKQGHKASTSFWVGSEAAVGGVRPTHWRKYDGSIPFEKRIDELVSWFTVPPAERPVMASFYLDETNAAGHKYGPDAPEVAKAVANCDRAVALILERLRHEGIEPNLIIISDHGMIATSEKRVVFLEDYYDRSKVQIDTEGSAAALRPLDGDVEGLMRALKDIPHAKAYRVADLPARLHFSGNPRIAPVWVLPEEGWHFGTRAGYEKLTKRYAPLPYLGGDHGYDPALRNMHGLFIAHGPAFRRGKEIPQFENIHIYNLMCAVLKLKPAPNDGDDRLVKSVLK